MKLRPKHRKALKQAARRRAGRAETGRVVYVHTRSLPERVAVVAVWWVLVASTVMVVSAAVVSLR